MTHLSPHLKSSRRQRATLAVVIAVLALLAAACGSDDAESNGSADASPASESAPSDGATSTDTEAPSTAPTESETATTSPAEELSGVSTSVRDSGLTVTVQEVGELAVHSLVAPEEVFANATHIIETSNSLVLVDTQFLLPNALDMRAYADELGKPIDRLFITHDHPDHFLGSEAFADVTVQALADVADGIAAKGDAEVAEKQADFGEAIAGTYVIPDVIEPGSIEIDGTEFLLERLVDAEAEVQLVIRVPDAGAVVTGDVIYSGVHLILAGQPDTWTAAIEGLAETSADYPIVLAGHGPPTDPSVYDANIAWLATAAELIATVDNSADFKQGLIDAYPDLGMPAAIDFVFPFLFPEG